MLDCRDGCFQENESLNAGYLILCIYMKRCWLHGRSLIELRVGSSAFPDEVKGRVAPISFFSPLFWEGIAAIFVLFSQCKNKLHASFQSDSLIKRMVVFVILEPPTWDSGLSGVLKALGHRCSTEAVPVPAAELCEHTVEFGHLKNNLSFSII